MKSFRFVRSAMAIAACGLFHHEALAAASGTAFTYQCRLLSGTNSADGIYDLKFSLFDSQLAGGQIGSSQTNSVIFTNGLATTTLDFGSTVFDGSPRWLEIAVRTNGSVLFDNLQPRQPLTPTPYAISASNLSGTVSAAQLTGALPGGLLSGVYDSAVAFTNPANVFGGNGSGLTFGGFSYCGLPCYWKVTGNSGTSPGANFVGTTDNQPLELRVFGQRALRLEPTAGSPNVIGGYVGNFITTNAVGATIGGGGGPSSAFNSLEAVTNYNGIQYTLTLIPHYGTISGGLGNHIKSGSYSIIAGGISNLIGNGGLTTISAALGVNTISGGSSNIIADAFHCNIGGGLRNGMRGDIDGVFWSTIGGGMSNSISGFNSPAAGCVISGGTGNFITRASGSTIGGGGGNSILEGGGSTISGGSKNFVDADSSFVTIAGGFGNVVEYYCSSAVISGGTSNRISGPTSTGGSTRARGAVIGGGYYNLNAGSYSFIGGGSNNVVNAGADQAVIGGGTSNSASGILATIPGGWSNTVSGTAGFAAGYRAKSLHDGAFVWADKTEADFPSTNINSFSARCVGGARFVSAVDGAGTPTAGVVLTPGSGSWTSLSDRNAKDNFEPVHGEEILDRLASIPISTWNYKAQDKSIRHMGPMAQDFAAAFHVGDDDKGITTVDADGVALAAIQGLNKKLAMKDKEIRELKQDLADLRRLVTAMAEHRATDK